MIDLTQRGNGSKCNTPFFLRNGSSPLLRAKNVEHVIIFGRQVQGGLLNVIRVLFW